MQRDTAEGGRQSAVRQSTREKSPVVQGDTVEEDLRHGQIVLVTARWILVGAGLVFAIWNPGPVDELRLQILVILMLAVGNFYLHAMILMRRPALAPVAYAASAADVLVVTSIVLAQGGFPSNAHIFYFPAVMILSVAFPTEVTLVFTAAAVGLYGAMTLATATPNEANLQIILTRLLMLVAMAVCGNQYWRIERNRRAAAAEARDGLLAEIQRRAAGTSKASV